MENAPGYRLVVLDIDGTISSPTTPLSDFTREVIRELVCMGIHVVLATGKQYSIANSLVCDLGLRSPQITAHGATITDPLTGKTLFEKRVPRRYTEMAIAIAERLDLTLVLARDGQTFTRDLNKDVRYMLTFGDPYPKFYLDLRKSLSRMPTHMMVIAYDEPEKYVGAESAMIAELGDALHIARSSPFYLDMVHHSVSKGDAVKKLSALLQIDRSEIVAIGDGENDISMFQIAGYSVAMGNSTERVKASADTVTEKCQENGAANALARIFHIV